MYFFLPLIIISFFIFSSELKFKFLFGVSNSIETSLFLEIFFILSLSFFSFFLSIFLTEFFFSPLTFDSLLPSIFILVFFFSLLFEVSSNDIFLGILCEIPILYCFFSFIFSFSFFISFSFLIFSFLFSFLFSFISFFSFSFLFSFIFSLLFSFIFSFIFSLIFSFPSVKSIICIFEPFLSFFFWKILSTEISFLFFFL